MKNDFFFFLIHHLIRRYSLRRVTRPILNQKNFCTKVAFQNFIHSRRGGENGINFERSKRSERELAVLTRKTLNLHPSIYKKENKKLAFWVRKKSTPTNEDLLENLLRQKATKVEGIF